MTAQESNYDDDADRIAETLLNDPEGDIYDEESFNEAFNKWIGARNATRKITAKQKKLRKQAWAATEGTAQLARKKAAKQEEAATEKKAARKPLERPARIEHSYPFIARSGGRVVYARALETRRGTKLITKKGRYASVKRKK